MLGLLFAAHWLAGAWPDTPTPAVMRDVNGKTLSVGQTVSVVGVITALTPADMPNGRVRLSVKYGPATNVDVSTLNLVS